MTKPEPIIIIDEFGTTTVVDVEDNRTLEMVKQSKINEAASERDAFIIEGFRPLPFNIKVRLDETTEARLTGAKAYLNDNPTQIIYWSLGGGNILELTQPMVNTIANQASAHVQRGFKLYGLLCQQINNISTIDDMDNFDIHENWLALQNGNN